MNRLSFSRHEQLSAGVNFCQPTTRISRLSYSHSQLHASLRLPAGIWGVFAWRFWITLVDRRVRQKFGGISLRETSWLGSLLAVALPSLYIFCTCTKLNNVPRLLCLFETLVVASVLTHANDRVSGDIRCQVWRPLLFYYPCEVTRDRVDGINFAHPTHP